MSPEAAEALLRTIPEYAWLTQSGRQIYTTAEVAEYLHIGVFAVRVRCQDGLFPGAIDYGIGIGWRIPRSGLILYLANRVQQGQIDAG